MRFNKIIYSSILLLIILFPVTSFSEERMATDQLGRIVNVPGNPQRVIAFAPSITEIIFSLEQEHRLKGVTTYSDYPEQAKTLPRVGSYVHLDLEKIVSLRPDLCFATKDGNPKSIITRLDKFNIPVYTVDPRDLHSVMETVSEIGKLLNANQQAKEIIKTMRFRIKTISDQIQNTDHKPKVFFQIGISPIVSAGNDTFIHELIVMAGGDNLAQSEKSYPKYSKEQIFALKPEVFILSSMINTENVDRLKSQWDNYSQIPAIKNNRLYYVDSNIFHRPTPRAVDALELLAKLIHPEIFDKPTRKEIP